MADRLPAGERVVVYDDDQAYMAGVIADYLATSGRIVSFVTPASIVSPWTETTLEQARIQRSLLEKDVDINPLRQLLSVASDHCEVSCTYTGKTHTIACDAVVLVTERRRESDLFDRLQQLMATEADPPLTTLELIGDAAAPGLIADAVYSGHKAARDFERNKAEVDASVFRREIIALSEH